MNELFRFLMLRPAEPADPVPVGISEKFRAAIEQAPQGPERDPLKAAAAQVSRDYGLLSIDQMNLAPRMVHFGRALRDRLAGDPEKLDLAALVHKTLGADPAAVVASGDFHEERLQLGDLLIAAKVLSTDGPVAAATIEDVLRLMDLVRTVAAGAGAVCAVGDIRRALTRPAGLAAVELPPRVVEDGTGQHEEPARDRETELDRQHAALTAAAHTLQDIAPGEFVRPEEHDGRGVEDQQDARQILGRRLLDGVRAGEVEPLPRGAVQALVAELGAVATAAGAIESEVRGAARLKVRGEVAESWTAEVRTGLELAGVDLERTAVPGALERVTRLLSAVDAERTGLREQAERIVLVGSSLVPLSQLGPLAGNGVTPVGQPHGTVQPVGVGDLLVVREHIKKYEGGELAHVENALDGEHRTRVHKRARTTEETVTVEVETRQDDERDVQSTERFELARESSTVVKEDSSLKAGLSVSGSYGPVVEFKASTDLAMNNAKEESAKTASKFSKEVTARATSKVSERRREERIRRTLEVFEEINEHGLDNPAGNGHVIGAYQWVDKVYEAQVFNYGKRMMFDFMIPEPGAFWLHAIAARPRPGAMLTRPVPFTLTPAQLAEFNYEFYVQRYQVEGVKPPPAPYVTVARSMEGSAGTDAHGMMTKIADLPVPDGYQAVSGHVTAEINSWKADWSVEVAVGNEFWRRQAGGFVDHYFTFDRETGAVPVAVKTFQVATLAVALEVNCQRTDRALKAWQLDTHTAITQAWLRMERAYRDELAALEVQAATAIQGRNPVENRSIERTELKKFAISTITAQHFDFFDAMGVSPQGYPQPVLAEAEAEGRFIRFFEQAFEWEHMMYVFYPYYWGRKAGWLDRSVLRDTDPQFAEFLRAGAARLVVPARPGFETAVAHFLDTGEIWEGADPPLLSSPLYLDIVQEIKERDDAPGIEVPQGPHWDVRLPTTLVRLREDGSLPVWIKNAAGEWTAS
jgi:hypothetical protein